jgi:cytochrome bd-type quinol oxidase subunit 2
VKRELGIGRLLIAVYGIFAISATARASYQLLTEFSQAPVAYLLSLFSAVVYLIATLALAQERSMLAVWAVVIELVGVLLVGALSFLVPELFAHPSVWSGFGAGYGYVPLVLPILGLVWLRSRKSA